MQRLNHGKRSAEARAVAAENAAQQWQQELAALKMLTASMLAQPHGAAGPGGPLAEVEGTESAKHASTVQASNSAVDTLTQQKGSCVSTPSGQSCYMILLQILPLCSWNAAQLLEPVCTCIHGCPALYVCSADCVDTFLCNDHKLLIVMAGAVVGMLSVTGCCNHA